MYYKGPFCLKLVGNLHEIATIKYVPCIKYLLNAIQYVKYFVVKYLKPTFEKKSHEIGSIKYGPVMQYLLNTVQ